MKFTTDQLPEASRPPEPMVPWRTDRVPRHFAEPTMSALHHEQRGGGVRGVEVMENDTSFAVRQYDKVMLRDPYSMTGTLQKMVNHGGDGLSAHRAVGQSYESASEAVAQFNRLHFGLYNRAQDEHQIIRHSANPGDTWGDAYCN